MNWRERIAERPALVDINSWPRIPPDALPTRQRRTFVRRLNIVTAFFSGVEPKEICRKYDISKSSLTKLLNRCLGGEEPEPPLTSGLIPHLKLRHDYKNRPFEFHNNQGTAYSFNMLLEKAPGLHETLTHLINKSVRKHKDAPLVTPQLLHRILINHLVEINWPQTAYPFTTEDAGYESTRKFLNSTRSEMELNSHISMRYPRTIGPVAEDLPLLFDEVQIDAHTYDATSSIFLDLGARTIPIRISRFSLLISTDVATGLILSYHIALTPQPSAHDVMKCLTNIFKPWEPLTFSTPEFDYKPDAGYPNGIVYNTTQMPMIQSVCLDNALAHHANIVREFVINKMNTTFNYGLPANPRRRNWVEHAFSIISEVAHTLPTTTGNSPIDPRKEKTSSGKKPTSVTYVALTEIIEIMLANENCKPLLRLQNLSPLDAAKHSIATHYLTYYPPHKSQNLHLYPEISTVTIRCRADGEAEHHINYQGARYKGACIMKPQLANKKVHIAVNWDDVRTITVLDDNGQPIGIVTAIGIWSKISHSLAIRKKIIKSHRDSKSHTKDPIAGYLKKLLDNLHSPSNNLALLQLYHDSGIREYSTEIRDDVYASENKDAHNSLESTLPDYTPDFVMGRKNI